MLGASEPGSWRRLRCPSRQAKGCIVARRLSPAACPLLVLAACLLAGCWCVPALALLALRWRSCAAGPPALCLPCPPAPGASSALTDVTGNGPPGLPSHPFVPFSQSPAPVQSAPVLFCLVLSSPVRACPVPSRSVLSSHTPPSSPPSPSSRGPAVRCPLSLPAAGAPWRPSLAACAWPAHDTVLTGRLDARLANPRCPQLPLIICSLHGLFVGAGRHETCRSQAHGLALPCRSPPPLSAVSWPMFLRRCTGL